MRISEIIVASINVACHTFRRQHILRTAVYCKYIYFVFMYLGSTDAALITLLHTVFTMLTVLPFVRVFALDFSTAFDTVNTYVDAYVQDAVYN